MAAVVPVAIRYLAEKDASVDRIAQEVRSSLANSNTPIQVATASTGNSLAEVTRLRDELEAVRREAGTSRQELEALRDAASRVAPPMREWIQEEAGAAKAAEGIRAQAEQSQRLASVSTQLGTTLAVVGAGLLAIAGAAIQSASRFEQYQQQLVTLKGSVEGAAKTFEFARRLAAVSPFDVQGVVAATVTLEAYKQKAETILPAVANLAAGMGKRVEDAALVVGKAASGSLEGFESLRNEYGITTEELRQFGAQANAAGGILARSPAQIELARNALLTIIQTRFGDAIERQSKTFAGALSNLGDAVQNSAARIGQSLLPVGQTLIRVFTGVIDVIGRAPAPMLALAGAGLVVGGTLATVAGASTLAVAGLVAVNAQLSVAAPQSAAASVAYSLTARSLTALGSAATFAGTGLRFLVTNPVVLALVATQAVVLGLTNYVNGYSDALRRSSDEVSRQAQQTQALTQDYRQMLAVLNNAGRGQGVRLGPDAFRGDIAGAVKGINPGELSRAMREAGSSVEDYKKKLESARDRVAALKPQIDLLKDALETGRFAKSAAEMAELGLSFDSTSLRSENLQARLQGLQLEFERANGIIAGTKAAIEAVANAESRLDNAIEQTKRAGDFLGFAKQIGGAQALTTAFGALDERIRANARNAQVGFKTALDLALELQSDKYSPDNLKSNPLLAKEAELKKEQIKALVEAQQISEQLAKKDKEQQDANLADRERTFRLQKALHGRTLEEELAFQQEVTSVYKRQGEAGQEAYVKSVESEADLRKQIHRRNLDGLKRNLAEELANTKAARDQETAGNTATQKVDAIDAQIAKIEKLRQANAKIIAQQPEIRKLFDDALRSAQTGRAAEVARIPAENLKLLKDQISSFSAEAVTAAEKQAAVERAIALVKQAQSAHMVDQVGSQRELVTLTRQAADLERQITAERNQRQAGLRSQELQAKEAEIQLLEKQRDAGAAKDANGKDINRSIIDANKERLGLQLANIEANKKAELDAVKGSTQAANEQRADIERKFGFERQAILRAETSKVYDEMTKQTQAVGKALDQQDDRYRQSQRTRNGFGGPRSPFSTNPQLGSGIQTSSLGEFGDGFGQSYYRTQAGNAPSIRKAQTQVQSTVDELERKKRSGQAGQAAAPPPGSAPVTYQSNNTIISKGGQVISFTDSEFDRNVLRVLRANQRESERSPSKRK